MSALGATVSGRYVADGFDVFDRIDGFPLLIRRYEDGKVASETAFKKVIKTQANAKLFEVPASYKRTELVRED